MSNELKLTSQESALIKLLRDSSKHKLPVWAISIECQSGAWDVSIHGLIGGMRGVGPTFAAAWDACRKAEPEDFPFPPP